MPTIIRPEITQSNKYWISKERYYELKHFCLQYPEMKRQLIELSAMTQASTVNYDSEICSGRTPDTTGNTATKLYLIEEKLKMIERAAEDACGYLSSYILKAVTEDYSYPYLKTYLGMPCGRDRYYTYYRKFFWILDKVRE